MQMSVSSRWVMGRTLYRLHGRQVALGRTLKSRIINEDRIEEAGRPGTGPHRFQHHGITVLPDIDRVRGQMNALGQTNGLAVAIFGHRGSFHDGKVGTVGRESKPDLVAERELPLLGGSPMQGSACLAKFTCCQRLIALKHLNAAAPDRRVAMISTQLTVQKAAMPSPKKADTHANMTVKTANVSRRVMRNAL
jgi:hypothetical protein